VKKAALSAKSKTKPLAAKRKPVATKKMAPRADPNGILEGDGKTGRHLKVRSLDELPRDEVRGGLARSASLARKQS
jgi:hypothetical protein